MPECEKRIALGESLTEKPDNAKADASVQEENPGDKQTKPEVKPMQRVYGTGNKSWLADRKKEDAEKNKKAAENAGYDNTSGIMFGIISVAAQFLGFMWMDIYDADRHRRCRCAVDFNRASLFRIFFTVAYIRTERHIHVQKSQLIRS